MSQYKGQKQIPLNPSDAPVDEFHWKRGGGPAQQVRCQGPYSSTPGQFNGMYLAAFGCEPGFSPSNSAGLHLYYDSIDIVRKSGDWFELTASQAGETLTEIHEVIGSNKSSGKDGSLVFRLQMIAAGYASLDKADAAIATIKENASLRKTDKGYTAANEKSDNHAGAPAGALTLIDNFSADIKLGDTFIDCMYTYRHTVIIPERTFRNNTAIGYAYANIYNQVGRSFTEAQVRSAEGLPASPATFPCFVFPKKISNPAQTASWLKQAPHCQLTTGQKRVITVEYMHADIWSSLYYPAAT
jgi:hypothetical protein